MKIALSDGNQARNAEEDEVHHEASGVDGEEKEGGNAGRRPVIPLVVPVRAGKGRKTESRL